MKNFKITFKVGIIITIILFSICIIIAFGLLLINNPNTVNSKPKKSLPVDTIIAIDSVFITHAMNKFKKSLSKNHDCLFVVGETIQEGSLCCMNKKGFMVLADADIEQRSIHLLGIALEDIDIHKEGKFLLKGSYRIDTLKIFTKYHISFERGKLTPKIYLNGCIVRTVGCTLDDSTILYFEPDMTWFQYY